jgi:hypothetical protein
MNWSVKGLLIAHKKHGMSERELFNRIVDIADADALEGVMTSIPPEYLPRFRDWIQRLLPSLDTLIHIPSGPLTEHEKATIRAIAAWLDDRLGTSGSNGGDAATSGNGLSAADRAQPLDDSSTLTPADRHEVSH